MTPEHRDYIAEVLLPGALRAGLWADVARLANILRIWHYLESRSPQFYQEHIATEWMFDVMEQFRELSVPVRPFFSYRLCFSDFWHVYLPGYCLQVPLNLEIRNGKTWAIRSIKSEGQVIALVYPRVASA